MDRLKTKMQKSRMFHNRPELWSLLEHTSMRSAYTCTSFSLSDFKKAEKGQKIRVEKEIKRQNLK